MTDELNGATNASTAREQDFPRVFVVFALVLGLTAIASMAIAVSVPVEPATNYFGRPASEVVGPGIASTQNRIVEVVLPKGCIPDASIRLTSPERLQAIRVCRWASGKISPPVTVTNLSRTARAFGRLSRALAQPDANSAMPTACPAMTQAPLYVSVRVHGRWFALELPRDGCGLVLESVDNAFSPLAPITASIVTP